MSSSFGAPYNGDAVIDGDLETVCASLLGQNEWISVRVPDGTPIDYVAVYNRIDSYFDQVYLSPYEIWIGMYYGDTSSAFARRCAQEDVPVGPGPFLSGCGGTIAGSYVTLRQVGVQRYLTIPELAICHTNLTTVSPAVAPPPAPPIASISCETELLGAQLSSVFGQAYPSSAVIDDNLATISATQHAAKNWVSVRLSPGTPVQYVAVYNSPNGNASQAWLSPFEIWIGSSYGDTTSRSATRCAEVAVPVGAGPFMVDCNGIDTGAYVTLRQVGAARYLTIAELKVCKGMKLPAKPPLPPLPPAPPPPKPRLPPPPFLPAPPRPPPRRQQQQ